MRTRAGMITRRSRAQSAGKLVAKGAEEGPCLTEESGGRLEGSRGQLRDKTECDQMGYSPSESPDSTVGGGSEGSQTGAEAMPSQGSREHPYDGTGHRSWLQCVKGPGGGCGGRHADKHP